VRTKIIEAVSPQGNFGKFLLGVPDEEWSRLSEVEPSRFVLGLHGWTRKHVLIVDLATGEGAFFLHGGLASADLRKKRVWVCPLFEPLLEWFHQQQLPMTVNGLLDLSGLPNIVHLDHPLEFRGCRRSGG
jgi:hypothetical protein